jgi:hypothetical protein
MSETSGPQPLVVALPGPRPRLAPLERNEQHYRTILAPSGFSPYSHRLAPRSHRPRTASHHVHGAIFSHHSHRCLYRPVQCECACGASNRHVGML